MQAGQVHNVGRIEYGSPVVKHNAPPNVTPRNKGGRCCKSSSPAPASSTKTATRGARCRVERGSLCPLLLGPDGGMRFPRSTRKAFDSFVANVELVAALRASSRDTEGGCGLAEDAPMVMRRRRRANTSLVENARGWTGLVAMSWVVVAPYGDLKPFAGGDKHVGGGDLNTRREIDFDKLRTRF
ncbi:hypothetical protein GW17_00015940 [Ensete ventricosum]|nr:hypothetical protein GW17_00015940 [Ensete ventricosum]